MTQGTSKLVSPVTLIRQLLESAGQVCHGPVILKKTKLSQKHLTIDITLTVSCARNSDTGQIMVASPLPSPLKPNSLSQSSPTSSPNISGLFPLTLNGSTGWRITYDDLDTLLASPDVRDGFLVDETTLTLSGKQLLMILKALSLI